MARKAKKAKKAKATKAAPKKKTVTRRSASGAKKKAQPKQKKIKAGAGIATVRSRLMGAAAPGAALLAHAANSNQAILDNIMGGHLGDDVELADVGYDNPARKSALCLQIQLSGVPVDCGFIGRNTTKTIGQVRAHMNAVKPEWNP